MVRNTRNLQTTPVHNLELTKNVNNLKSDNVDQKPPPSSPPSWATVNGPKVKRKADNAFEEDEEDDGKESSVLMEEEDELEEVETSV
jgi:hypothetical protein